MTNYFADDIMPVETMGEIFKFLDDARAIVAVKRTCRRMYHDIVHFGRASNLWRRAISRWWDVEESELALCSPNSRWTESEFEALLFQKTLFSLELDSCLEKERNSGRLTTNVSPSALFDPITSLEAVHNAKSALQAFGVICSSPAQPSPLVDTPENVVLTLMPLFLASFATRLAKAMAQTISIANYVINSDFLFSIRASYILCYEACTESSVPLMGMYSALAKLMATIRCYRSSLHSYVSRNIAVDLDLYPIDLYPNTLTPLEMLLETAKSIIRQDSLAYAFAQSNDPVPTSLFHQIAITYTNKVLRPETHSLARFIISDQFPNEAEADLLIKGGVLKFALDEFVEWYYLEEKPEELGDISNVLSIISILQVGEKTRKLIDEDSRDIITLLVKTLQKASETSNHTLIHATARALFYNVVYGSS